nr:S1 RNA-binding domain-containing protein [uncultured Criibacterium sp.]
MMEFNETNDMSEMEKLLQEEENNYQEIYKGTVIEGKVLIEKDDAFYVDLKYKTDGVLPKSEVFDDENIKVGDTIKVYVTKVDKNNGEVLLSKRRVDEISSWEEIKKGDIITVTASDINNKGIIADYKSSIRGFIPLGHIELRYIGTDIAQGYLGKDFEVEVLDVDPKKRRLILSRKAILQKAQEEKFKEISDKIEEGKVFTGIIRDIKDYGLFVDIGGIVGLVHISEVSYDRNIKIHQAFHIDDKIQVKVINYDSEGNNRLSLSIKALSGHPWDEFSSTHNVGDVVEGEVKNIKDYGVFVNLAPVVDGFVHISNLSQDFIKNPKDILKVGDKVEVKIIGINQEEKKIELSMLFGENAPAEDGEQKPAEAEAAKQEDTEN